MSKLSIDQSMTVVKNAIVDVAPELASEVESVDPAIDVWEWLELDSMDHMRVMEVIHERTGVDVPDRELGRLRSLASLAEHVATAAV